MFVVNILERKSVIRFFGLSLILAPFVNTGVRIYIAGFGSPWNPTLFWGAVSSGSAVTQILFVGSVVIGLMMLRGASTAWRYALLLLGSHIVHQLANFSANVKANWISAVFFVVNIAIFLFIADQLVWKVKARPKSKLKPLKPKIESPPRQSTKRILVDFEGFGVWAQLVHITSKGVQVRCIEKPPFDLSKKEIEISLKNGTVLKTRMKSRLNQDFYFEYVDLKAEDIRSLNQWLRRQDKAA